MQVRLLTANEPLELGYARLGLSKFVRAPLRRTGRRPRTTVRTAQGVRTKAVAIPLSAPLAIEPAAPCARRRCATHRSAVAQPRPPAQAPNFDQATMHLTNTPGEWHEGCVVSAAAGTAGAPDDETEVTPAMLAAGRAAYRMMDTCDFLCDPDGWLGFLYKEMTKAKYYGKLFRGSLSSSPRIK
jgi:hypothetical protein